MASLCLKRKQPSHGAVMVSASMSYGPPSGVSGLYPPEPSPRARRRRRRDKLTWVEHTLTPYFDGHLWRKYGQKLIKDSPFPRLYFRCSYREDKNCMAAKQVQQENFDDPPLFMVTYEHEHTCDAVPVVDAVIVEAEPPAPSDGLVLKFSSCSGSHHGDVRMQQEWLPMPPSPFFMMNSDSSNGRLHDQQPAFTSDIPPLAPSSFFVDGLVAPPSTDDEGGMLSTWEWDLFRYCMDDHLHVGDHPQFPVNSPGNLFSWEVDGCSVAHALTGVEAAGVI
ncbi:hypothetical protein ACP70R_011558 [Stipagrostis hirtigluma subsp. patula]